MSYKPGMYSDWKFTLKFFLPAILAGLAMWLVLSFIFWLVIK